MAGIVIRYAHDLDVPYLLERDRLVSEQILKEKVAGGQVIVAVQGDARLDWLRFGTMWDTIPFMNLIVVEEGVRGQGIGRMLVDYWEREMKARGHQLVMTSTDADEEAQHFHRKLGYRDAGILLLPRELFPNHTSELLMVKVLP